LVVVDSFAARTPNRNKALGKSRRTDICPIRIAFINGIAVAEGVEVGPALVVNRVAVEKLADAGIVVAMRQAEEARFNVCVVAVLSRVLMVGRSYTKSSMNKLPASLQERQAI
jgi:hypothetical protein